MPVLGTTSRVLITAGGVLAFVQGAPAPVPLPAPNATLDADFTRVMAVRELADGRVLVTDAGERKLILADFAARSAAPLGRAGQGPEEYQSVGQLFALAGDSTLLVDPLGGRWLLLHGSRIVQTVAADAPAIRAGARSPMGADTRGAVLATRFMGAPPTGASGGMPSRTDSLLLLRIARASARTDTVAGLQARPSRILVRGPQGNPTSVEITTNPLASGDGSALFGDGAIAIARVNPYRVDWIDPNGNLTRGARLPFMRVRVSAREKDAVLRREAEQSGRPARSPESVADWPEFLPPMLAGALLPAPDGHLWIRRTPSAEDPDTRYDIIARSGRLVARITIPRNEQVVGFGKVSVYSVQTDQDGLQHLRRHPIPR